ncbi:MAG: outer membrane lipoprotein chaperone LolA [Candidatus Thiodiazotropha lotti]|uniref:Outer-membrane lipoprotein carrier protein n=1 Tax=Candidatus Thiodiazotropha endoloripes TaxID=1818881 RepID=A0A1E2UTG4_9GAMM|nr:outer membrane lipoprotein chaperone LolA [Candidatus Thiodiazotropha endoloripes]MCG7897298.1 outer membrane lipoprotein chaperone LolA [Candidatus Thiodiazotropha weberae]MCG7990911.1 outer membrane lipoprotein chaperone LolA [Candidatus Thiodiazotropha lotti]MCG7903099.1 outer membrane lipoprotein chaperone LolA [Candidatus Thiodiazotropha weberae]MCG7914643.1 outer membrane lipoprotein chaperone LolA [Candidatus Thiodiazotropha weberae]MCG8001135.1 outer membrane lipoprotein chaperone L
MKKCLSGLMLLLFVSLSQTLWAESGIRQLETFLQDLKTLKADFRQTLQQPDYEQVYASNGVFYLRRPGQLRWEYQTPSEQLIVADGDRIWLHDIELEQVSHRSQEAVLDGTPAQLLSGTGPISQHFQVNELGIESELTWVELVPKSKEAQFASVRLALQENRLERMEMFDNFGQVTRFFFENMQRNPQLDDALFEFEPPPLIDLIGDL